MAVLGNTNRLILAGYGQADQKMKLLDSYHTDLYTIDSIGFGGPVFVDSNSLYSILVLGTTVSPTTIVAIEYDAAFSPAENDTSVISNHVTQYLAVADEDYVKIDLASNIIYEVETDWSCSTASNPIPIYFTLVTLDSYSIPLWVKMDSSARTLVFDPTPTVSVSTEFRFSIETDYTGDDNPLKKFYITVLP